MMAVQEFLVHSINILRYDSLESVRAECEKNGCYDFERSEYYILNNGRGRVKDAAEESVVVAYKEFESSSDDDKLVFPYIRML